MLRLSFSSKLDWGLYIISIANTVSKKIVALIHSMKYFFLSRMLCIFIDLSYSYVWNTVVTSGLVPPIVTRNC